MLDTDLFELDFGPLFPATLRMHTEALDMLSYPPKHHRTVTHGGLHAQLTMVRGRFQVLIVNSTSGDGISIEMPSLTDAINAPGTDAFT